MDKLGEIFETADISRVATDAELDASESLLRAPLPQSYRDFARRHGEGVTNVLLVILMPFSSHGDGDLVTGGRTLATKVHDLVGSYISDGATPGGVDCLEPHDRESALAAASHQRLTFFGTSIDGHHLAWMKSPDGRHSFFAMDRACFSIRYCGR